MEDDSLLRRPGAWIPLAVSLAALAFLLGYVAVFGIVQNEDEGAPARIFRSSCWRNCHSRVLRHQMAAQETETVIVSAWVAGRGMDHSHPGGHLVGEP
jgi:hypothetical protein